MAAGRINRVDAAAKMYGHGSKQHKAAMKRFGKSGGPTAQTASVRHGGTGRGQSRDSHGRWN